MNDILLKIVHFDEYCPKCKWRNLEFKPDDYIICDHCVAEPVNENSHKPVKFEPEE